MSQDTNNNTLYNNSNNRSPEMTYHKNTEHLDVWEKHILECYNGQLVSTAFSLNDIFHNNKLSKRFQFIFSSSSCVKYVFEYMEFAPVCTIYMITKAYLREYDDQIEKDLEKKDFDPWDKFRKIIDRTLLGLYEIGLIEVKQHKFPGIRRCRLWYAPFSNPIHEAKTIRYYKENFGKGEPVTVEEYKEAVENKAGFLFDVGQNLQTKWKDKKLGDKKDNIKCEPHKVLDCRDCKKP